jgi:2-(1,2-epoxy-1,2-dihydrophenyl)acetyl-CoA isomerase
MSDAEPILVERRADHHVITFHRPDKLNAFDHRMHEAFHAALDGARDDASCRALLITGAGRAFCVGQDLADVHPDRFDGPPRLGEVIERYYNPAVRRIRALPLPVVCAVNGVAAGAGANLAFACDLVIAARSAKFIQAFAKIGLVPDSGGTWSLVRHLGPARAMGLALTGEPLPAERAEAWGLIWRMVDDDRLAETAGALVAELAQGPTHAYALTKRAMAAASHQSLDEQLELECTLQDEAGRSPDYAEGVHAFVERRAPKFSGRT